ncbi:hypothetical protein KBK19_07810 [Microvirga sp. STR05]|uniref:Uncharacterized protein n=1 Tax=Hymenobacter duratus TaxID=2771356 RepID=A0ABR8JDM0_9BACT|nr:hypothetical protein [Hymenobacter duratus]MBD2714936.1 hypothetical protein [Hymenobacter duratus]MBR7949842.1 hypothetical protein [Microvirga sp. STR05]
MLLLDAGPLDLAYGLFKLAQALGVLLLLALAFFGARMLIRLRRKPANSGNWLRTVGGVLLLLPAGSWLSGVVYSFSTQAYQEWQEDAEDARGTQQCVGWYQATTTDTLSAGTGYSFDLQLGADGRYTWKTTLPTLDSASSGNWSIEMRDFSKPYVALISSSNPNSHVLILNSCDTLIGSCWQGQTRGSGYGTPAEQRPLPILLKRQ